LEKETKRSSTHHGLIERLSVIDVSTIHLSKDTVYDWFYSQYDPRVLKKCMRRKYKEYRDCKKEKALG
jgi:hypothetical protein